MSTAATSLTSNCSNAWMTCCGASGPDNGTSFSGGSAWPVSRSRSRRSGDALGVTRQRISELEKKALARLGPGEGNRRRRKPAELTFVEHLTCELRSRHRPQRGQYLRATFPETNDRVLAEVLGRLGPVGPCEVASWLRACDVAGREEDEQARRRERLERRWTRFVEGVTTPGREVTSWPVFRPCRAVAEEGGTRWSAKLGRHVQYDSGLEETLILLFDESPHVAEYCEQPLRIRYQWFDGPHDYVPDFALRLQDGRTVLVEAKPRTMWVDAVNLAKWNAATRLCHGRGWAFVVSDGRGHPGDLIRLAEPADRSLLDAVTAAGPASYPPTRRTMVRHGTHVGAAGFRLPRVRLHPSTAGRALR